jgi:pimeloyl-ACP methyl ester carboxylesterase
LNDPEVLRLKVDSGESIVLDWYPVRAPAPAVLFIHGLGSHRRGEKARYFAGQFNAVGRAFAALDLRGHGGSDGSARALTMSRLLADVSVAASWTAARSATGRTALIGASMGAAVAMWHAAQQPMTTEALVLLAPSLYFPASLTRTLDAAALERWRATGVHRFSSAWIDLEIGCELLDDVARYAPDELCAQLVTPALLIHGLHDTTIPWKQSAAFLGTCTRAPLDLFLVGDGDHRLTAHKELLFSILCAWLERACRTLSGREGGTGL